MPRAGWRGSEPLRTTEQHPAPFRPHPLKASTVTLPETCDRSLSHLTTPHKLQAEARLGKPSLAGRAVWTPSKPMAEACQLHAVVRRQQRLSKHRGTASWARFTDGGQRVACRSAAVRILEQVEGALADVVAPEPAEPGDIGRRLDGRGLGRRKLSAYCRRGWCRAFGGAGGSHGNRASHASHCEEQGEPGHGMCPSWDVGRQTFITRDGHTST
jgi:hypothetical protein